MVELSEREGGSGSGVVGCGLVGSESSDLFDATCVGAPSEQFQLAVQPVDGAWRGEVCDKLPIGFLFEDGEGFGDESPGCDLDDEPDVGACELELPVFQLATYMRPLPSMSRSVGRGILRKVFW